MAQQSLVYVYHSVHEMNGSFTFADLTEGRIFLNVEKSEWSYGRTAKCCLLYSGHAVPTTVQCSTVQPARYVVITIYRHEKFITRVAVRRGERVQDGTWQFSLNHELTAMLLKRVYTLKYRRDESGRHRARMSFHVTEDHISPSGKKKTGIRAESALMKSPRDNIRNQRMRQMSLLDVLISENLTQIGMQRTRVRLIKHGDWSENKSYNSLTEETLEHPAHSHDQAPSDYHLFPALKQNHGEEP